MNNNYKTFTAPKSLGAEGEGFIKAWINHVPLEDNAIKQLKNTASLPFIYKHVAVMPDAHRGMGSTVGTVIASKGALIPAAVGVDIGCGICAIRLSLRAEDLPDNLDSLRSKIESAIPHGRTANGDVRSDRGARGNLSDFIVEQWNLHLATKFNVLKKKHQWLAKANSINHLGTLGGGNHFIELCLDTEGFVWVMLHSGSRGVGNTIGQKFIEKAKKEMEKWGILDKLPDEDLAYLTENTENFDNYVEAVDWAQLFAKVNRDCMMHYALLAIRSIIDKPFEITQQAINCHHNYVVKEQHFDDDVWITRKGAVSAQNGQLGIIPGSMGAKSFIVKGLGNAESFCSCSHGAGRIMSRADAKKLVTIEEHIRDTAGVNCRKDESVLDETPKAYKNIEDVMRSQSDLVEIVHTLKQVLCVKG